MTTRRGQLAFLHTMKREQGLSDDDYRDKLERVSGKRSAADLDDAGLAKAVRAFHVKRNANQSYTAKVKALFIAAYNLGAFDDGSDRALDAFVERQTGKERLAFLTSPEANSASEALKAICARHGFAIPANDKGGRQARINLLQAQWARLGQLGAVHIPSLDALSSYVSKKYLACHGSENNLTDAQLDDCAKHFGDRIRRAQAGKAQAHA